MKPSREFATDSLHVFVLVGFAVAQPLFAVLGEGATFFVARRSEPAEIIRLAAILCFGLPAAIVFGEFIIGKASQTARKWTHFGIVAFLLSLSALPVLKNLEWMGGMSCLIVAAAFGPVVAAAYYRFNALRTFFSALSPAILLFPGLFLCRGPVSEIVWAQFEAAESDPSVTIHRPSPIVFVVFDEFPTVSLMDDRRLIDPVRYPHFAAFAKEATWFRNMTTNSPATIGGVASLLTGNLPAKAGHPPLPTVENHPINLFTLLDDTYDVYAFEAATHLSPTDPDEVLSTATVSPMSSDLWVIFCHILIPKSLLPEGFPDVSAKWADFHGREPVRTRTFHKKYGPLGRCQGIIATFRPTPRLPLYYGHFMMPHTPFVYLPSGEKYADKDGRLDATVKPRRFSGVWIQDELKIAREYQRHLLQVECTDRLLGELVDHLKTVGLYDDALIVITADHGVCHRPGHWRRNANPDNLGEVMAVPLLIKVPGQKVGAVSDRNVESIDVLPTIAGIIGLDLLSPVDGDDALEQFLPERPQKVIYQTGLATDARTRVADGRIVVDAQFKQMYAALERKLRLFGSGNNPNGIFQLQPHERLVARPGATLIPH